MDPAEMQIVNDLREHFNLAIAYVEKHASEVKSEAMHKWLREVSRAASVVIRDAEWVGRE